MQQGASKRQHHPWLGGTAPAAYTNGAHGKNASNAWLPDGTPVIGTTYEPRLDYFNPATPAAVMVDSIVNATAGSYL
jgi:hypothetical protein